MEQSLDFIKSMETGHIPTWDELPDLELYMDQVIVYLERQLSLFGAHKDGEKIITPAMINNYVKLGLIPPPNKKKYGREHLAFLIVICIQKPILPIPHISRMLQKRYKEQTLPQLLDLFSKQQAQALSMAAQSLKEGTDDENSGDLLALQLTSLACSYRLAAEHLLSVHFTDESKESDKE